MLSPLKRECLLIDVNIFEPLLKSERNSTFRLRYNNFYSETIERPATKYTYLTPPFLALELLGLSKKIGCPPIYKAPRRIVATEQISSCENHALSYYDSHPELEQQSLLTTLESQVSLYSKNPEIQKIAEDTIIRVVTAPGFRDLLIAYLSNRYAQQADRYHDFEEVAPALLFSALESRANGNDTSVYQVIHDYFYWLRKKIMNSEKFSAEARKKFKDAVLPSFKTIGDFLDGDLIHYSIMGLHERRQSRVIVITGDKKPENTHERVAWAKTMYLFALECLKIIRPEACPNPFYGRIISVEKETLTVSLSTEVKKLRRIFRFDLTNEVRDALAARSL